MNKLILIITSFLFISCKSEYFARQKITGYDVKQLLIGIHENQISLEDFEGDLVNCFYLNVKLKDFIDSLSLSRIYNQDSAFNIKQYESEQKDIYKVELYKKYDNIKNFISANDVNYINFLINKFGIEDPVLNFYRNVYVYEGKALIQIEMRSGILAYTVELTENRICKIMIAFILMNNYAPTLQKSSGGQ